MRDLTYTRIIEELGAVYCGQCWNGRSCLVANGKDMAEISNGTIHWHNRQVTRPGLRNFLKLWASIVHSHNRGQPLWRQLHEQNVTAYRIAREFGVILPRHLSRHDRTRAFLDMAQLTPKPEPAIQWARGATRHE